ILLAGSSGGGKSTFAVGFLERLAARQYPFCVVDPEGDYETLDSAVALGDTQRPPSVAEVVQLLESPENNAVINLVGLPLNDRPGFFHALFPRLQEMGRARDGRSGSSSTKRITSYRRRGSPRGWRSRKRSPP